MSRSLICWILKRILPKRTSSDFEITIQDEEEARQKAEEEAALLAAQQGPGLAGRGMRVFFEILPSKTAREPSSSEAAAIMKNNAETGQLDLHDMSSAEGARVETIEEFNEVFAKPQKTPPEWQNIEDMTYSRT